VRALPDRWVIAIGGSAVMLLIGTVYSWAIFAQPLVVAFGWDLTTTTWAYAIANFSLATVGVVVGGFWLDRKGPRRVAMTGVALWGAGNVLAGLGTPLFGVVSVFNAVGRFFWGGITMPSYSAQCFWRPSSCRYSHAGLHLLCAAPPPSDPLQTTRARASLSNNAD
jgi:MFS family permease